MQRKDLALRVLSTAAIMSIVTSIAAPAFAGTYYMDNGNLSIRQDAEGKVWVKSGDSKEKQDTDGEVIICGGAGENQWSNAPSGGAAATTGTEGSVAGEGGSAAGNNAEGGSAPAATTAAGTESSAAGESQPDPDAAFNLSEEEEDSEEGKDPTDNPTDDPTANSKKDVVYQLDPADPEPEQQATKPTLSAAAAPAPKTPEATLADNTPATTTPAAGSVTTPTTNVINVINNWVGDAAKELKIRLSNVNIKTKAHSSQWDDTAAMTVSGSGNTKIELDGNNVLDSTEAQYKYGKDGFAGLNKQGAGTLTITDEKTDDGQLRTTTKDENDKTGTLTAVGGIGAAGIGGNGHYRAGNNENVISGHIASVNNIVIEGYANVTAISGNGTGSSQKGGAGIGGGDCQNADNIIIRGNANVMAKSTNGFGAAIGGGYVGSATNIKIYGNANVTADASEKEGDNPAAAIGKGYGGKKTDVTIGSEGKSQEEKTTVKAKSCYVGIGGMHDSRSGKPSDDVTTNITIQGGATVESESKFGPAIGANGGNVTIVIKDNAHITKATTESDINYVAIGGKGYSATECNEKVDVSIQDNAKLDKVGWIGGQKVKEATVKVKDSAEIGDVVLIGGDYDTAKTTVNILNNVVVKKLTGMIGSSIANRDASVTIDGGADGKVKINENAPGYGSIHSKNLTIGDNVLIKLRASSATDTPVDIADSALREKIKNNKSAEIWYTNTSGTSGTLYKIIHSEDLCKKSSTKHTTKEPTCTEPGSASYACDYENANHAENPSCNRTWTGEVPALGHDYQKTSTVPPTCGAQGYDEYTCKNNPEHTYRDNYTSPTGQHTWGAWTVKTPATCEGEGEEERECSVCHQKDTRKTAALGHDFHGTETVTKAPTCAAKGSKTVKCTRCDAVDTQDIPIDHNAHNYQDDWTVTTPATCTTPGVETRYCNINHNHSETRPTAKDSNNHAGHGTYIVGKKDATCTTPGYTGDTYCDGCHQKIKDGKVIPATGHNWVDNGDGTHGCSNPGCGEKHSHSWVDKGDGTHTCPDCGAAETLPVNTNSALELRVVDAEGMDQPFTVSQNGTLRTYTGAYDTATLTGDLDTLRYLQEHGAQTIQFVTNGQTSSFAINDLLAQGSGSEVFYLTHRGAEEPTLLLVEADHSELVKD